MRLVAAIPLLNVASCATSRSQLYLDPVVAVKLAAFEQSLSPRDSSSAHLREEANPGLLLRPCVIASSCIHPQWWHFLGKERQLDFNLPPLTVTSKVAWTVGKYILVAQLKPDVLGDNREIVGTVKGVRPSARDFRDLGKKLGT